MSDAKTALVTTFKYNNAVIDEGTSLNVGVGLIGMINPNLDARLPVVFGIDNSAGGHCIVCDGYGYDAFSTMYHHLNMGWGGDDNAWYDLPIIDLTDTESYINIDACVYNVFTNGSGEIISGRVLTNGVPIANASVTATRIGGGTYTDGHGRQWHLRPGGSAFRFHLHADSNEHRLFSGQQQLQHGHVTRRRHKQWQHLGSRFHAGSGARPAGDHGATGKSVCNCGWNRDIQHHRHRSVAIDLPVAILRKRQHDLD